MFDVAVVGGGPGGYVAAIKAAQAGLKVALIERDSLGGVCLNWGCIPSKNLIHQAKLVDQLEELVAIGAATSTGSVDYARMQEKSRDVVKQLTTGIAGLMKKNKVTVYQASASLATPNELVLSNGERVTAQHMFTNFCGTSNTCLRSNYSMFSNDYVVSNLYLIVKLHSFFYNCRP